MNPFQPPAPNPTGPIYTRAQLRGKKKGFPFLLILLQVLATLLVIFLIWQSVAVYVNLGRQLGGSWVELSLPGWWRSLSSAAVIGWLLSLITWLLGGGAVLISVIGMLCLYAILQVFEVAPMLLENSPDALRSLIKAISMQGRLAITAGDDRIIAYMKERHNTLPQRWVQSIYTAKWIAYALDLVICLIAAPPIRGGWQRLSMVLMAPVPSDFDWKNASVILITLFAVEAGVSVFFWIRRGRQILTQAQKEGGENV